MSLSRAMLLGLRASVPRRAFSTTRPAAGVMDKAKEAWDISKQHVKAAVKNQKQGMEDIAEGRATAGQVRYIHIESGIQTRLHAWLGECVHVSCAGKCFTMHEAQAAPSNIPRTTAGGQGAWEGSQG